MLEVLSKEKYVNEWKVCEAVVIGSFIYYNELSSPC